MSDREPSGPVMAGNDDASDEDRLAGLIEQVEHDHSDECPGAMADELRDRVAETKAEPEDPGDLAD